jgi:uncharacterized protein GlcG (DUF336 family)
VVIPWLKMLKRLAAVDTDDALELIAIARQIASERGITATVAVHDAAGHPVALARGAKWHGPYMAMGKARLAAAFQKPTADLLVQWTERPLFAQSLVEVLPGGVTLNPGGYPIVVDGVCIGAVGIGGSSPDNDHEVAKSAVEAFVEERQVRASEG